MAMLVNSFQTSAPLCINEASPNKKMPAVLTKTIALTIICPVLSLSTQALAFEPEPEDPAVLPPVEVPGVPIEDEQITLPPLPGFSGTDPGLTPPNFGPGSSSGGDDSDDEEEEEDADEECRNHANQARQECIDVYSGIWNAMCVGSSSLLGIRAWRVIIPREWTDLFGVASAGTAIIATDYCATGVDNAIEWCNHEADRLIANNCQ